MKKILVLLWIVLEKKEKKPLGNFYTYTKINIYNPLSWIFIAIAIPISIFQEGYSGMCISLKNIFKWS
jgi:hypothetical protein